MNKELEEAIIIFGNLDISDDIEFIKARETILNYIENSISKEVIKEKIKKLDEEIANTDELDSYTLIPLIEQKETLQKLLEENNDNIYYVEKFYWRI